MADKNKDKKKYKDPRDFSNREDDYILRLVLDDFKASDEFQRPYFDIFRECYKQYKSYIDKNQLRQNRSNLFIPYTFHVVETVTPKIVNAIFQDRPYVTTRALGQSPWNIDRETRSAKMNAVLDYQLEQRLQAIPLISNIVKSTLMYGTAITKQSWVFESKTIKQRQPFTLFNKPIKAFHKIDDIEVVVKDDPKITLISLMDFFFDPTASNIVDGRYAIHRYWLDYSELMKMADRNDKYRNIDELDQTRDTAGHNYGETGSNDIDIMSPTGAVLSKRKRGIEILEYWTDDYKVMIADRKVVIFCDENPYYHREKPFARWVDHEVPGEFYGMGEIEPIMPLQEELNVTRNQRIDNVAIVLNKMYKVLRNANVDPKQLISKPGGFIEVDDMDDVKEIEFRDVTASSYNEETVIKGDIDKTLGVFDTVRGSDTARRETATTASLLANAGGERFRLKILLIAGGGMRDAISQIIRLNQQYIDKPLEIYITGNDATYEYGEVSPEEILGEYDIAYVGSAVNKAVTKEIQQSHYIQLLNVITQNPYINQPEFLKRLFNVFEMKDVDGLIYTEEEVMQRQMGQMGQIGQMGQQPMEQDPMAQMSPDMSMLMGGGGFDR